MTTIDFLKRMSRSPKGTTSIFPPKKSYCRQLIYSVTLNLAVEKLKASAATLFRVNLHLLVRKSRVISSEMPPE